jgi:hypothetical protein
MSNALLDLVRSELIPVFDRPVTIIDELNASSPGDSLVILRVDNLRIVVVRDRGEIRIEVGTMDHPEFSPGAQSIGEFLGLGHDNISFTAPDTAAELRLVAAFLTQFWDELTDMFSRDRFTETRKTIEKQQKERVRRLFGDFFDG